MTIAEEARAILQAAVDQKVAAVDAFVAVRAQREQAAAALRAAVSAETNAWTELKRLDWSDSELRSLGLLPPSSEPAKRTRRRRSASSGELG